VSGKGKEGKIIIHYLLINVVGVLEPHETYKHGNDALIKN